jgi:hypothetical protein
MLPLGLKAQKGLVLSGNLQYMHTSIYNKDDKASSSWLKYDNTYRPQGYIGIGYSFDNTAGLKSVTLGIGYSNTSQQYTGTKPDRIKNMQATTSLQYLHIPVVAEFALNTSKWYMPYLFLGGYFSYLINYRDEMSGSSLYASTNDVNYLAENDMYSYKYSNFYNYSGKMTSSLYNKVNIGILGGLTFKSKLHKALYAKYGVMCMYGLNDTENKSNTLYSGQIQKYYLSPTPVATPRSISHNINWGVQLGVEYYFNNKNHK